MLKGRKVAVIFTASILGGHEVMAVSHLSRYIKKDVRVTCYIPSGNSKLAELLIASSICYEFHDVRHNNMEIIHSFFNPGHIFRAAGFLISIKEKFDFIFIIQGDIEFGSVFVNVGKMLGIKKSLAIFPILIVLEKWKVGPPLLKTFLPSLYIEIVTPLLPSARRQLKISLPKIKMLLLEFLKILLPSRDVLK